VPPRRSTLDFTRAPQIRDLISAPALEAVTAEGKRASHPVKVAWIGIEEIDETPEALNSRSVYEEASLNELACSLQEHGILQPLCVRPKGSRYELVFGMRRLKAAIRAGLSEVPCTIRVADDDTAFLLNAVENLHRRQLSGAERVRTIERLAATNLSTRAIAQRTGFSQTTISQWLRLDRQPLLKQALDQEQIDIGRAMALVGAPEEVLPILIGEAHSLSQPDLKARVADLRTQVSSNYSPRSVDTRRIMEMLRLASLLHTPLSNENRGLLAQVKHVVDGLLGPTISQGRPDVVRAGRAPHPRLRPAAAAGPRPPK
jgi:ParB family chromosome partitioning protein